MHKRKLVNIERERDRERERESSERTYNHLCMHPLSIIADLVDNRGRQNTCRASSTVPVDIRPPCDYFLFDPP